MHPKRPSPPSAVLQLAVVLVAIAGFVVSPAVDAAVCSRGQQPAATLLVPYFEVDVDAPGGQTTLFSIGNVSAEPALTHVIVWSDLGVPLLGFFVHLGPEGVETINLRDVIGKLQVPDLQADADRFPGCTDFQQPIGGVTVEELQARLTGKPDPGLDRCFGRPRGDTSVAVGFVTVDVASDCASQLEHPDAWIFGSLAADANVLWGDIFHVDPDQDSAQGSNAVPIRDDPEALGEARGFYPNDLDRVPADQTWRTRYISGSGVGADTEMVVWINSWVGLSSRTGFSCGDGLELPNLFLQVRSGPQSGPLVTEDGNPFGSIESYILAGAVTRKFSLPELLEGEFPDQDYPENGVLELEAWDVCWPCPILPPDPFRLQSIVRPTYRATDRFSLALDAMPIDGSCIER